MAVISLSAERRPRVEDAGEHAHGQSVDGDGGHEHPHEADEGGDGQLAGEQVGQEVADEVART